MENVETPGVVPQSPSAGCQLKAAREAAGLSRSDIAAKTKVAERHLQAIEEDRLEDLAARTYAVGFSRAYARALGLDEQAIAAKIREQLDRTKSVQPQTVPTFEPGDPARVPSRSIAWLAGLGVAAVVVAILVFWSSYLKPQGELPDLTSDKATAAAKSTASTPVKAQPKPVPVAEPTGGPVVLTAAKDKVWLKVTDANGVQVLQKEMAQGESWTVPNGATGLKLRTGRPDALQISVGGKVLPFMAQEPKVVSNVSLEAADLLSQAKGVPAPLASPAPAVSAGATDAAVSTISD